MNDYELDKIQKFANDDLMSKTVFKFLLESYIQDKPSQDVYVLAASRLAINLLKQGFKDMEKFKVNTEEVSKVMKNIGV